MAYKITGTCKVFNFRKLDFILKRYGIQPVGSGYDKVTGEKYVLMLIDEEFKAALEDWNRKTTQDEYAHTEENLREY